MATLLATVTVAFLGPGASPAARRGAVIAIAPSMDGEQLTVRQASWPEDYEAVCAVRSPTQYVVEDGTVGFMGRVVELSPEEALDRRVQARLGTALRDNATVILATLADGTVVGTVDCIPMGAGSGRRRADIALPRRFLIRNVWVEPARRRQGLGRRLMAAAEEHARAEGVDCVALEVNWDNEPARLLYEQLGYAELEPPSLPVPQWMRGAIALVKRKL